MGGAPQTRPAPSPAARARVMVGAPHVAGPGHRDRSRPGHRRAHRRPRRAGGRARARSRGARRLRERHGQRQLLPDDGRRERDRAHPGRSGRAAAGGRRHLGARPLRAAAAGRARRRGAGRHRGGRLHRERAVERDPRRPRPDRAAHGRPGPQRPPGAGQAVRQGARDEVLRGLAADAEAADAPLPRRLRALQRGRAGRGRRAGQPQPRAEPREGRGDDVRRLRHRVGQRRRERPARRVAQRGPRRRHPRGEREGARLRLAEADRQRLGGGQRHAAPHGRRRLVERLGGPHEHRRRAEGHAHRGGQRLLLVGGAVVRRALRRVQDQRVEARRGRHQAQGLGGPPGRLGHQAHPRLLAAAAAAGGEAHGAAAAAAGPARDRPLARHQAPRRRHRRAGVHRRGAGGHRVRRDGRARDRPRAAGRHARPAAAAPPAAQPSAGPQADATPPPPGAGGAPPAPPDGQPPSDPGKLPSSPAEAGLPDVEGGGGIAAVPAGPTEPGAA